MLTFTAGSTVNGINVSIDITNAVTGAHNARLLGANVSPSDCARVVATAAQAVGLRVSWIGNTVTIAHAAKPYVLHASGGYRNLGFSSRLLVGLEPSAVQQWVEIAAGSADLTIGVRDADRSVRWLGQPERVSEDTMAWTLPDRGAQPVSWLEIASETRRVRVRLADAALALFAEHGWGEAIDDSVAEPVLWVADLLEGIAEVLTGICADV